MLKKLCISLPLVASLFLFAAHTSSYAAVDQTPKFQIERIYLKSLMLEQPHAPKILLNKDSPAVNIVLDTNAEQLSEGMFEVTVRNVVTAHFNGEVLFKVDVTQAGIFELRNLSEAQLKTILTVKCPDIIYPYLRAAIADTIVRAGFPVVHLSPINFEEFEKGRKTKPLATPTSKP